MMNGPILSKLNLLDEVLNELRTLEPVTLAQLEEDWRTRRAIERDLLILVEIVVDVCQRLIALADQSPAATSAEAIRRCVQLGVLESEEPYRKMVQFRNFIVHRYERIDPAILADVVNRRLGDFDLFRKLVMAYAAH